MCPTSCRAPRVRAAAAGTRGACEFSPGQKRRTWGRRVGVAVAVVALLAAVAYGVWSFTLTGNLNDKLALKNSDAASALVAAKSGDPFYTLVVAELDTPGMPNSADGPDALALVRTDASGKNATIVSIPCDLQVSLKDGKYYPLREASVRESDASLVSAVANFADVSIAHVVKIDAVGLTQLVDVLGGVDVDASRRSGRPGRRQRVPARRAANAYGRRRCHAGARHELPAAASNAGGKPAAFAHRGGAAFGGQRQVGVGRSA